MDAMPRRINWPLLGAVAIIAGTAFGCLLWTVGLDTSAEPRHYPVVAYIFVGAGFGLLVAGSGWSIGVPRRRDSN